MNETVRDRSPQSLENEIIALTHRLKCLRPALSPSMDGLTPMEAVAQTLQIHFVCKFSHKRPTILKGRKPSSNNSNTEELYPAPGNQLRCSHSTSITHTKWQA